MNDFTLFLKKFIRHGTAIASLAPSSRKLSLATVANIDWANTHTLLELGAGTGPITAVIAEKARPDCRIMALERDPDFVERMKVRFANVPNVEVIQGDVRNLPEILAERGLESVDAVVSGLPIPSFPPDLQEALFDNVRKVLKPGGPFSQITEMPWVYLRLYRKYFDNVRFRFEPRNLPPAGAYHCSGPKASVGA
ncbi:methyltransferase domain-containing protein [bacterium]|nr:methyltransferase domain-containing protein [bacterium]